MFSLIIHSSLSVRTVHVDWCMNMHLPRVHPSCSSWIMLLNTCEFHSFLDEHLFRFETNSDGLSLFLNRQKSEIVRSPMVPLQMPQKLRFNITPEVKRDIERAKQNMNMYVRCCHDNY